MRTLDTGRFRVKDVAACYGEGAFKIKWHHHPMLVDQLSDSRGQTLLTFRRSVWLLVPWPYPNLGFGDGKERIERKPTLAVTNSYIRLNYAH